MAELAERSPGTASEQSGAGQAMEKVQETAQQVQSQLGGKASEVRGQVGGQLKQQIDTRSTDFGEQISSAAQAARRIGEELRKDGKDAPARFADEFAQRTERLGKYLRDSDSDRILRDAESFARRQPWLVGIGGAAIGFLASRLVKASGGGSAVSQSNGSSPSRQALGTGEPAMASFGESSFVAPSSPGSTKPKSPARKSPAPKSAMPKPERPKGGKGGQPK